LIEENNKLEPENEELKNKFKISKEMMIA